MSLQNSKALDLVFCNAITGCDRTCDSASQPELVIPIILNNAVVAVFDIDSPKLNRFTKADQDGLQYLLRCFLGLTDWPNKIKLMIMGIYFFMDCKWS